MVMMQPENKQPVTIILYTCIHVVYTLFIKYLDHTVAFTFSETIQPLQIALSSNTVILIL